jgi:hypothetical protein
MDLSATKRIELDGSVSGQVICELLTDTPDGMTMRQTFVLPATDKELGGRTNLYPAFQLGFQRRLKFSGPGTLKLFSATVYSQTGSSWRRQPILQEMGEVWVTIQPEATVR